MHYSAPTSTIQGTIQVCSGPVATERRSNAGRRRNYRPTAASGTAPSERRDPRAVQESTVPRRTNLFATCTGTELPKRRDPARDRSLGTTRPTKSEHTLTSVPPVRPEAPFRSEGPSAQKNQLRAVRGPLSSSDATRQQREDRGLTTEPATTTKDEQTEAALPPGEALLACRAEALQDRLGCPELPAGLAAGRAVFPRRWLRPVVIGRQR
ncbi:hypothetical protein NDU88_004908 [Pleurodeles waltl]|uniref:Uncharacterized protein n=1 Tax=Pleurodeles waltl TaxID=8319 RepID=A0AAV7W8V8_PLEWA|nr:hypothetical protein NDU88_004908 [Pleurodeles waltl]